MSDDSARLGLPYVRAGQLQKHVTVNEAFSRLDALVQMTVQSRETQTPPAMVEAGQMFIMPAAPQGGWSGFAPGALIVAEMNGWRQVAVSDGMIASILDEQTMLIRLQGVWEGLATALGGSLTLEQLGVGSSPDAANPFSARLNKALWAAKPTTEGGDGDLRFTFNKQSVSHTASLLFQSNWQGRAELGLTGDDDLRLKVSADGTYWSEALNIDRSTGRAWFAQGATRSETVIVTASGSYTFPSWVRRVEAICVGGGGAGGAGSTGAAGTVRLGGGGGGAGGYNQSNWLREHLGDSLAINVGNGGSGVVSNNGLAGGATTITAQGRVIIRASGGSGGQFGGAGGVGGAGGLGAAPSNSGGSCGEDGVAQTGQGAVLPYGSGAGGSGGGLSAANAALAGGAGGAGGMSGLTANGGSSGTSGSGVGVSAPLPHLSCVGGGGGGGPGRATGTGFIGSAGGAYGGGGGGGGAGSTVGGTGGAGGAGVVILMLLG